jgi:flagellar protein FliL
VLEVPARDLLRDAKIMAAEEAKTESPSPILGAPSAGGSNKLILLLVTVNMLITLGMIGVLFMSYQKEKNAPKVEDIAVHSGVTEAKEGEAKGDAKEAGKTNNFGRMVTLEQFTVNLSTPGSVNPKFVRVNISLEVPTEDAETEVTTKMPQVRNAIIDLFNSKRPADLATAEGRDYLKEEIRNALNGFLVNGKVRGVYFTNFALSS